ncbi:MAG: deoxynucleoside kinase [Cyclobacteriaceae bacterium]|nr:MAG: deoxynucleoside kinase [Cyclobacteriaceae bacterium]
MHIAVSGNIASGKTSLTEKLADHYGWIPLFESVDKNPYLADFYDDMMKWAFHLQVYFLSSRFQHIRMIDQHSGSVIQDRTIYEDAHVFAKNLHLSGLLNDRDFLNYQELFNSMMSYVRPPDLLIYLKADVNKLAQQIQQRGRVFEKSIPLQYLENLNTLYRQWIEVYDLGKLLVVEVNKLDFVSSADDFSIIVDRIDSELSGLS